MEMAQKAEIFDPAPAFARSGLFTPVEEIAPLCTGFEGRRSAIDRRGTGTENRHAFAGKLAVIVGVGAVDISVLIERVGQFVRDLPDAGTFQAVCQHDPACA